MSDKNLIFYLIGPINETKMTKYYSSVSFHDYNIVSFSVECIEILLTPKLNCHRSFLNPLIVIHCLNLLFVHTHSLTFHRIEKMIVTATLHVLQRVVTLAVVLLTI